jgi:hypothetical protein
MFFLHVIKIVILRREIGLHRPIWALSKGLFGPCLMVSSKVFQVVFVHLFYNTTLLLASVCCSFFLQIEANFICIVLVSHHWLYFQLFQNFLILFVSKTSLPSCSEKCHLDWCQSFSRDTGHEKPTPHSRYSFRHTKLRCSWKYTSCLATQLWERQSDVWYYTSYSYPEIDQMNVLNENCEMDHSAVGTQGKQYIHFLLRYLWHSPHPPSISKPPHCRTLFRFWFCGLFSSMESPFNRSLAVSPNIWEETSRHISLELRSCGILRTVQW